MTDEARQHCIYLASFGRFDMTGRGGIMMKNCTEDHGRMRWWTRSGIGGPRLPLSVVAQQASAMPGSRHQRYYDNPLIAFPLLIFDLSGIPPSYLTPTRR